MTKKDYERFLELSSALSPENLWMDGEATPAQAKTRERALTRRWKSLEQAADNSGGRAPVLVIKRNRSGVYAVVQLDTFFDLIGGENEECNKI